MDERHPERGDSSAGNGEIPWRLNFVDAAAPSARQMQTSDNSMGQDPNTNGQGGNSRWRAGYTEVAPAAVDAAGSGSGGAYSEGNGPAPWRNGYNEVAPPAVNATGGGSGGQASDGNGSAPWLPRYDQTNPGASTDQTGNSSGSNSGGGDSQRWEEYARARIQQEQGGAIGFNPAQSGQPGVVVSDEQRRIIARSLERKTSQTGFLWTGGLTGLTMQAGMYGLDAKLLSTPLDERNAFLQRWEKYSPAMKALSQHQAAFEKSKSAYAQAAGIKNLAEAELQAVKDLPSNLVTNLEQKLPIGSARQEGVRYLSARRDFMNKLPNLSATGGAADILGVIGKKGQLGKQIVGADGVARTILFVDGTAAANQLKIYAADLSTGKAIDPADFVSRQLKLIDKQLAQLGTAQAGDDLARRQIEFLRSGKHASLTELKAAIGTADEVASGAKLWETGSTHADDLLKYATKSSAQAEAVASLSEATKAMEARKAALELGMAKGPGISHGSLFQTSMKGLGKGLGISALTLGAGFAVDNALGKAFGYEGASSDGYGRLALDGVVVPAFLLSGLQGRYKYPLAASTFLTARGVDMLCGSGAGVEASMFMRPNLLDGVGVTGSLLAPLSPKARMIGVAGSLALGRAYNLFARATGLDGGLPAQLDADTKTLAQRDLTSRSESSFVKAAEKAKSLGVENSAALELQLGDFQNRTSLHPLDYNRGVASLSYGLGMARLESGSRLDPTKQGAEARILKGTNYDLGGDATMELRRAAGSLVAMQNWALQHIGESVNGKTIDHDYVSQLEALQKKVEEKLDLVYGRHDNFESSIYGPVKEHCRKNLPEMMQFIVSQQQLLQTLRTSDKRYVAKICRDLALANVAYADYIASQGNGEEARAFFQAAEKFMVDAGSFEGQSPDLASIRGIADRVKTKIPGAVQQQWENRFNNPFQIQNLPSK